MKYMLIIIIEILQLLRASIQQESTPLLGIKQQEISVSFGGHKPLDNDDIRTALEQLQPKLDLSEIRCLTLENVPGDGEMFKNGSFNAFSILENLHIRNSQLNKCADSIFHNLNCLQKLQLEHTGLRSLSPNLFKSLPNVRNLLLNDNKIEYLTSDIFEEFFELRLLDLSSNKLETLPEKLLHSLNTLHKLIISNNSITKLEGTLFSLSPEMFKIHLSYNNVSYIDEKIFNNQPILKVIEMNRTFSAKINTLPSNLFSNLTSLETIKLAQNHIQYLDKNIFHDLSALKTLDLSSNKLSELYDTIFEKNLNLETLNLRSNQLKHLGKHIFTNLYKLTELYLDDNQLSKLDPKIFFTQTQLRTLTISNNQVDLAGDNDYSILQPCVNIENLAASHNNISRIYKDWSRNSTLQSVDLRFNPLTPTDANINFASRNVTFRFTNSHFVDMKFKMSLVPRMTPDADKIILLDRDETCAESLSCSCKIFVHYQFKKISINCTSFDRNKLLEVIPDMVIELSKRMETEFTLLNCKLSSLYPVIDYLKQVHVTKLILSKNALTSLNDLPELPRLKELELDNNLFGSLDKRAIEILNRSKNLTKITLSQNPWYCDCSLADFYNFTRDHKNLIPDWQNITCKGNNKTILNHPFSDFCDPVNYNITVIVALFTIFIIIIVITMYLVHRYELQIKVWMFSHNICRWLVTEKEVDRDKQYDAFISYAWEDEWFVKQELLPKLEKCEPRYKLCVHIRDWICGLPVSSQIHRSVEDSRRTIIVLSPNYLKSFWGMKEFETAYMKGMKEHCSRILIILLEDIGDKNNLNDEMKAYVTMNTYLDWKDPWFWQKLKYALPHKHRIRKRTMITELFMDN